MAPVATLEKGLSHSIAFNYSGLLAFTVWTALDIFGDWWYSDLRTQDDSQTCL
jgi:hypothetical protein